MTHTIIVLYVEYIRYISSTTILHNTVIVFAPSTINAFNHNLIIYLNNNTYATHTWYIMLCLNKIISRLRLYHYIIIIFYNYNNIEYTIKMFFNWNDHNQVMCIIRLKTKTSCTYKHNVYKELWSSSYFHS
jgi:hypothetical protein